MIHCWKDKTDYLYETEGYSDSWAESHIHSGTCMLEEGHKGEHVFSPDDDIIHIIFRGEDEQTN